MTRRRAVAVALSCVAALALVGLLRRPASSDERVPANDTEVLERLPTRPDPYVGQLRQRLRANPRDVGAATALAQKDIETARARSDPRALGHAQAALAPWWDLEEPPLEVLILRATIRQSLHDFPAAIADLERVIRRDPSNAQAWLTKATVHVVRGEYKLARAACDSLTRLTKQIVTQACLSNVRSLTGDASGALTTLKRALDDDPSAPERAWAVSMLGEIALRAGDTKAALEWLESALASDPDDAYVLGAWSDLQLDLGHADAVVAKLAGKTDADALLLRLALAERERGAPDARAHVEMLRERFDAARARGDAVHMREEARFALRLAKDPARALDLATRNFAVQREPWDVRILLEAAEAAESPSAGTAAAAPALSWIDASGFSDASLAPLVGRARARKP